MKRIEYGIIALFVIIACALPFLRIDKHVPFQKVEQTILSKISLNNLKKADMQFLRQYYHLSDENYEKELVYTSKNAMGAEEIAIFYEQDDTKLNSIYQQVKNRLQTQLKSFQGYGVEQTKLLQQSVIMKKGQYVIYIAYENANAIASNVKKLF